MSTGLRPVPHSAFGLALMPPDSAGGKAPGAAAPGPPLGVEKESRADVRARERRGVVRVEAEKAGIAAIAPVATHKEDTPARVVAGVVRNIGRFAAADRRGIERPGHGSRYADGRDVPIALYLGANVRVIVCGVICIARRVQADIYRSVGEVDPVDKLEDIAVGILDVPVLDGGLSVRPSCASGVVEKQIYR